MLGMSVFFGACNSDKDVDPVESEEMELTIGTADPVSFSGSSMKLASPMARSIVLGSSQSLLTLLAGVAALLGADQGAPGWVQVPLLLWLITVGLPTTLAVLAVAALWGTVDPLYGLTGFMAATVLMGVLLQVGALHLIQIRGKTAR